MSEQKFKITNNTSDTDTFFCDQNGKTALQNAEDYITRNQGKFAMTLYFRSSKPKPFPLWEFMRFVPENTPQAEPAVNDGTDTPVTAVDAACCCASD